jgi:hypothetical protein
MPTVTLLAKIYKDHQQKLVGKQLKSSVEGLSVKLGICGVTSRGWVQIAVSGEDEKVALRHLSDEIGLCSERLENLEKFSTIKGCITALNKSSSVLYVDVGIFSPNIVDATIQLNYIQAQLVDGRKITLEKLVELFGFCENLPLAVKILSVDKEKSRIEATFSEKQIGQYKNWAKLLLDRLIILGAPISEVERAIKIARCDRDVVSIESLGLLECAVVCKLGTDAAGLIPKLGRNLRAAAFSIYSPRRISAFFNG